MKSCTTRYVEWLNYFEKILDYVKIKFKNLLKSSLKAQKKTSLY